MLAADVVMHSDGGGKASALRHPLYGREHVTRMLSMFRAWLEELGAVERRAAEIDGQPGAVFFDGQSRAVLVLTLDIAGGQVVAMRGITNREAPPPPRAPSPGTRELTSCHWRARRLV
jgi:RNA polymerase sigma-70 factor (ECF subfamily)